MQDKEQEPIPPKRARTSTSEKTSKSAYNAEDWISAIEEVLKPHLRLLMEHKVCDEVETLDDVRHFCEMHVFAVWDFRCLLMAFQMHLISLSTPWIRAKHSKLNRLITEITRIYESDTNEKGERQSHFEMYLEAMRYLGSDMKHINKIISVLQAGEGVETALMFSGAPKGGADFFRRTIALIDYKAYHKVAASLAFGRGSGVKTPLFFKILSILENSNARPEAKVKLKHYLLRQASLYETYYKPLSLEILKVICGTKEEYWRQAASTAIESVKARVALWDSTHNSVLYKKPIVEVEDDQEPSEDKLVVSAHSDYMYRFVRCPSEREMEVC